METDQTHSVRQDESIPQESCYCGSDERMWVIEQQRRAPKHFQQFSQRRGNSSHVSKRKTYIVSVQSRTGPLLYWFLDVYIFHISKASSWGQNTANKMKINVWDHNAMQILAENTSYK